jgi:hypothetical protein
MVEALCFKPDWRGFEFQWGNFFFNLSHSFNLSMVLGFTQPLTEMSSLLEDISGAKAQPARKADNINVICEPTV